MPDSNVVGGITNVIGTPRTAEFTASWYVDVIDTTGDYLDLVNAPGTVVPMTFNLGALAGAGDVINAFTYTIGSLRVTNNTKEDSDANRVLRSIAGYAVSVDGTTADTELVITAV